MDLQNLFLLLLVASSSAHASASSAALTPAAVAKLVADHITTDTAASAEFSRWTYGCGIIVDALLKVTEVVPGADYTKWINKALNKFTSTQTENAYKIVHGEQIPWGASIGDVIGLYPISYLHRATFYSNRTRPSTYNISEDQFIAKTVASEYILKWPLRWTDSTISRDYPGHWPKEKDTGDHQFVWGDDAFMGLTLAGRLLRTDLLDSATKKTYADFLAHQSLLATSHLADANGHGEANDGLYYHGQNAKNLDFTCCKWGRANGWTMMSSIEVLSALSAQKHPSLPKVQQAFVAHARALAKVQNNTDGRWHQLLNDTSTFLETSVTSMTLFALTTGIQNKWLDKSEFDPVIQRAWRGLSSTIQPNGTVTGICNGFGIHATANDYIHCKQSYLGSAPGLGSVLRAAAAMHSYNAGN
jgi:rhamnogalacturonyl hydrolase YesR